MAGQNLNRWVGTGNLTRDPEIKALPGGSSVANMRIAVNGRIKREGEWIDKANYFDVAVFGAVTSAIGQYLQRGSSVAIDGRLDYREWEKDGDKRSRVVIIADSVQFTDGKRQDDDEGPMQTSPASGGVEEDIPF
jgi:single-strand DNA-binding protein